MDEDGANKEMITDCYWHPYNLQFSPEGNKILFGDGNGIIHAPNDIWIIDLVTKTKTKLTNDTSYYSDPIFTPDGEKIIFVKVQLTNDSNSDKFPGFSPKGDFVYFHSDQHLGNYVDDLFQAINLTTFDLIQFDEKNQIIRTYQSVQIKKGLYM